MIYVQLHLAGSLPKKIHNEQPTIITIFFHQEIVAPVILVLEMCITITNFIQGKAFNREIR